MKRLSLLIRTRMNQLFSYGHDAARVQTCLLERSVNSHSQTCLNLCHIILYEKWVPKHEDCLWDIAQLALDCISSAFCDLPLAILMRSGTLTSWDLSCLIMTVASTRVVQLGYCALGKTTVPVDFLRMVLGSCQVDRTLSRVRSHHGCTEGISFN